MDYKSLYLKYEDSRTLLKLKNYALWTIPGAFPDINRESDMKGNVQVEHDYQSIGAILVNYLAAKLTGILFPVTQSFFKIKPTDKLLELAQQAFGVDTAAVNNELVRIENAACQGLYKNASYAQLIQLLRYLIITGNAMFKRVDGKLTVYSLRNFTQLRDNEGNLLDAVLRESWAMESLPEEVRQLLNRPTSEEFATVDVYTRIKSDTLNGNRVKIVSQQIDGIDVGEPNIYPENLCPYHVVVWQLINGDSNGRGLVEDHAGDFAKTSDLSRALAVYQINACRVVNLVKPGATVDIDSLNEAFCGEFVQGDPQNIQAHEAGDSAKMQQLAQEIQTIFQRLSMAFMYKGNMREAERVTAEEIQMNAREAESALGGVYSQLSQGIHLPLSYLLTYEEEPEFMSALIAGEITLDVITGLPALGRSTVVTQVLQAIQELAAIVPTMQQLSQRFDTERVIDLILQARGVNLEDIMLSPEALEAKQQAQQQAAQQEQAAALGDPSAMVDSIGGII